MKTGRRRRKPRKHDQSAKSLKVVRDDPILFYAARRLLSKAGIRGFTTRRAIEAMATEL